MTRPRKALVSLEDTPYYHVVSRCVRRAFLCGDDRHTGQSFEHRRQWILDRIRLLASIFTIDICAYAIMSNHYHLVLHIDENRSLSLTDDDVIERWCTLYKGPLLIQRYRAGEPLSRAEHATVDDIVEVWRARLLDISWFMRALNEPIARRANEEDRCKGRFWEGRFRSQALLDVPAVISAMAYVDLNPVRAGVAVDLEGSDFTSVQERIREVLAAAAGEPADARDAEDEASCSAALLPFDGNEAARDITALPFSLADYLTLCDWTGSAVREDKRGRITRPLENVLEKMGLDQSQWLELALTVQRRSLAMIGDLGLIEAANDRQGRYWMAGQTSLARIYRARTG